MRTLTYQLRDLKKVTIEIGFEGENNRTQVRIDCGEVFAEYPNAEAAMKVQAPKGGIYPATVTRDGNMILWTVRDCDVANKGNGEIQLTFTDGETVVKSCRGKIHIDKSLKGSGTAPSGVQDWLDNAEKVLEDLENAEVNQPKIVEGNWYVYNVETGEYVDTGVKAQGEDGDPGQPGTDATPDLITKDYADLTFPVAKDSFCYHDGKLYQAKQAIQTSEQWTSAHWTETTVEAQLNTVKSDLTAIADVVGDFSATWVSGKALHKNTGVLVNQESYSTTDLIPLFGTSVYFKTHVEPNGFAALVFYDEFEKTISTVVNPNTGEYYYENTVAIPNGAYYMRICCITTYISTRFAYKMSDISTMVKTVGDVSAAEKTDRVNLNKTILRTENITKNKSQLAWELGFVSSTGMWSASEIRMRTVLSQKMLKGTMISCDDGYMFRVYQYNAYIDQEMTTEQVTAKYVGRTDWLTDPYELLADNYYVICISTTSDTALTGTETHITIQENVAANEIYRKFANEEKIDAAVEAMAENTKVFEWEVGLINTSGNKQASTTAIRTVKLYHLAKGTKVFVDGGYMYRLFRFTKDDWSTFAEYYGGSYDTTRKWITGYFEIPLSGYYGIATRDYDSSTVSDVAALAAHFHLNPSIALNELKDSVSLGIMPYNLEGLKTYINSVLGMNGDVVIHIVTDIHGGYPDTYPVINYLANAGIGDCFFELGDVIKATYTTRELSVSYLRDSFKTMGNTRTNTPIVFLQGNHDTNPVSGIQTSKNVTQEIFYGLSMARAKNLKQQTNKAYGYVDIENAKVRLIYLNTSDIFDKTTGDALVAGQYTMIQQDQVDWFIGTALNFSDKATPTDWSVIIFTHDSLSQISSSLFGKILNAFQNGTADTGSYNITVDSYTYTLTCNCDFTSQGALTVICEVNGHHHKDMIRELGTTGIKQVYVACEGSASACYDDNGDTVYYDRVRGTTDEHLIDTLVLDKTAGKVYFKRFGIGTDREITY